MPSCAHWPHNVRPKYYYHGAFVNPEGEREAEDIDAAAGERRDAAKANLEKERSGALLALASAVRHFRRVWPAGTDNDVIANIMPSLDRTDRRRIMAFLRAARDLDIGL